MSVQALAAAFSIELESPTVKLVLLGLANYCDTKGRCWPSQKEIAAVTSLSERAVRDALNVLVGGGWVSREVRRRADGSRSTDVFTLLFLQPAPAADCRRNEPETQPASAAGSGAGRAGGGAPAAGPTTFEPPKVTSPVANAPGESPPAAIDQSKGCRLPPTWQPKVLQAVDDPRLTLALAQSELGKFRDFWAAKAAKEARKSDWDAAWRYWLRNTLDRLPPLKLGEQSTGFDLAAFEARRRANRKPSAEEDAA